MPANPKPSDIEKHIGTSIPENFPTNTSALVTGCESRYWSVPFSLSPDMLIDPVIRAMRGTKRSTRLMRLAAVLP
jgi:hypothetical protein